MKKTILILSGIFVFLLLAVALPYFNLMDVHPVAGWLIGLGALIGLPLLLVSIIVISIKHFNQKLPPTEETLDLKAFVERDNREATLQDRADNDQYV